MSKNSERIIRLLDEEILRIKKEISEIDITLEKDIYLALSKEFELSGETDINIEEKKKFSEKYYDLLRERKLESLGNSLDELVNLRKYL